MDGIILINKEKEYTSHDVVAIVKKVVKEKVGHTGTLDPNATGVLPVLVGKGTKLSKYLINHDKIYTTVLKLGIKTDTADITGNVIQEMSVPDIEDSRIKEVLQKHIGEQEQLPPMYSAIKVNGKKLYEYAREGKKISVNSRKINIYNLILEKYNKRKKELKFTVECSKGTYIRTLCEDIAESLGTIGTMKELKRVKVGEFHINNTITINELKHNFENEQWLEEKFITIEQLLDFAPQLILNNKKLQLFLNGVKLDTILLEGICLVYSEKNEFIGTGEIRNGKLKRDVIIE